MTKEQEEKIQEIVDLAYFGDAAFIPFCQIRKEWLKEQLMKLVGL